MNDYLIWFRMHAHPNEQPGISIRPAPSTNPDDVTHLDQRDSALVAAILSPAADDGALEYILLRQQVLRAFYRRAGERSGL